MARFLSSLYLHSPHACFTTVQRATLVCLWVWGLLFAPGIDALNPLYFAESNHVYTALIWYEEDCLIGNGGQEKGQSMIINTWVTHAALHTLSLIVTNYRV